MSVFKDDIGLSNALQKIQTNFFQIKELKENTIHETNTQEEEREFEKLDLSENTQKRQKNNENLENIQESKNILETAKQGLDSISTYLESIETKTQERLNENFDESKLEEIDKSIKDDIKNIQKVVENTSFKDIKPLELNSYDNIKNTDQNNSIIKLSSNQKEDETKALNLEKTEEISLKSKEDAEKFLQQVRETTKEVKANQDKITQYEKKLEQKVDSIIEFESNIQNNYISENKNIGKLLKEAAIEGILQDPTTGKKIQINNLDEKLILALLSIKS